MDRVSVDSTFCKQCPARLAAWKTWSYNLQHKGYLQHIAALYLLTYRCVHSIVPNTSLQIFCTSLHFHHALSYILLPLECFLIHEHYLNDLETPTSAFLHLLLEITFLQTFIMTGCCCWDLKVCWRHIYSVLDCNGSIIFPLHGVPYNILLFDSFCLPLTRMQTKILRLWQFVLFTILLSFICKNF